MLTLRVHADFRDSCHRVAMQLEQGQIYIDEGRYRDAIRDSRA